MPRNRRPDLNGVLVLDKPKGPTSARLCAAVRRLTKGGKVGHAGTLDPLATGVLVLCLGRATKAISGIMIGDKRYSAHIDLSAFTSTDDAEGSPIPPDRYTPPLGLPPNQPRAAPRDPSSPFPSPDEIRRVLADHFIGDILQRPPDFAAVKVGGRRAYKLARTRDRAAHTHDPAGDPNTEPLRIEPKPVRIHSIDILHADGPQLVLDVRCGKGVYIRSLARDLGLALGVGGALTDLRRTEVLPYTLEHARDPDDLPELIRPDDLLPVPEPPPQPDRTERV